MASSATRFRPEPFTTTFGIDPDTGLIPGLGKVVKQKTNFDVAAGVGGLSTEAVLAGKETRAFPLRFVDRDVSLGPLKVVDVSPLF